MAAGPRQPDWAKTRKLDRHAASCSLPAMKATLEKHAADERESGSAVEEPARACSAPAEEELDISLLEDSLAKSPWERMQANDDALRFAESLRAAMEERNAKSKRTNTQTG